MLIVSVYRNRGILTSSMLHHSREFDTRVIHVHLAGHPRWTRGSPRLPCVWFGLPRGSPRLPRVSFKLPSLVICVQLASHSRIAKSWPRCGWNWFWGKWTLPKKSRTCCVDQSDSHSWISPWKHRPVNSINTGTITSGERPMLGWSQEGGNNYKCRKQF